MVGKEEKKKKAPAGVLFSLYIGGLGSVGAEGGEVDGDTVGEIGHRAEGGDAQGVELHAGQG